MSHIDILLPKMGESVAEATIIKWLKKEGDRVAADEPLVEIATDKVDSEVPAPQDGILLKQMVKENDVVKVGQVLAHLGVDTPAGRLAPSAAAPATGNGSSLAKKSAASVEALVAPANTIIDPPASLPRGSGRFYSPLVRTIARNEGISMTELEAIPGTGLEGRLTKKDLLNYLPARSPGTDREAAVAKPQPLASQARPQPPAVAPSMGDELIEMDRMRRLIADHMVMSKQVSAHVTSFVEADVTALVMWREKVKRQFEQREGTKITFTPIFIQAIVQAIKEMPMINVQVDGYTIIRKKDIHIGMAAALPSGNLIVPVIRHADRLNLVGLARAVNDLAARARENKLLPDEVGGATYTMTNVGTFGNVMGTPIINQPQVAIMATGAIRKKPAVIETPLGDAIAIRHMMFLSHSYDHRVVDGALGGRFVRRVADILENWSTDQEF